MWPRGKVLGGSSSINGLLYIRGQQADYDGWRQLGCEGWSWEDVFPYFRRAEHQERGADRWHATGGPLNVSDVTERHPISDAVIDACVEAGIPRNDDVNADEPGRRRLLSADGQERAAPIGGRRLSASGHEPSQPEGRDATRWRERVTMQGRKATGVEYTQDGARGQGTARREVILAGGAINSPQLLQLSGIGDGRVCCRAWHRGRCTTCRAWRESAGSLCRAGHVSAKAGHGVDQRDEPRAALRGRR